MAIFTLHLFFRLVTFYHTWESVFIIPRCILRDTYDTAKNFSPLFLLKYFQKNRIKDVKVYMIEIKKGVWKNITVTSMHLKSNI